LKEECSTESVALYFSVGFILILGYLIFLLLRPHGMSAYFKIAVYYLQMQPLIYEVQGGDNIAQMVEKISNMVNLQVYSNILYYVSNPQVAFWTLEKACTPNFPKTRIQKVLLNLVGPSFCLLVLAIIYLLYRFLCPLLLKLVYYFYPS